MTDAARSLRQRNQPDLASADPQPQPSAADSQSRPALRFYEPLPLGSDAFMAPLAPPPEPHEFNWRRIALYGGLALGACLLLGGVGYALLSSSKPKAEPIALGVQAAPAKKPAPPAKPEPVAMKAEAAKIDAKPAVAAPAIAAPATAAAAATEPTATAPAAVQAEQATAAATDSKSSARKSTRRAKKPIDKPSRAQVIAAMTRVQPAVKACFGGTHGVATAEMKIKGDSGRVSSVDVSGQPGSIGSCIARAVRKARFPEFTDDSISIRYPMQY